MTHLLNQRRYRDNDHMRVLSRSVHLDHTQMIQPLFVVDGIKEREPIPGISGTYRDTPETLLTQIESDIQEGITKFLLFGVGTHKHCDTFDHSFTCDQIKAIKEKFGDQIWLGVDVCLCSSTNSGHCGVLNEHGDHVLNTPSVEALAEQALAFAKAGAECVAPSDMMDGRIGAMRSILDDHGYERTVLMSYAAKFASSFYGPFRVACDSAPDKTVKLKDRKTYQMDPRNPRDALACVDRDLAEGADIIMIKPATHYLDIIQRVADTSQTPVAAYYVSGEHALVEAAAEKGLIASARAGHVEAWYALRRAGTDIIITYAARHAKEWLS